MPNIIKRILNINLPENKSAFLWGPRRTGKTWWINENYKNCELIDLLKSDIFLEYSSRPSLLRERYLNHKGLIIIDEIQMVPMLLNEIHWLIENTDCSFLMTGSSARKLRRGHANLLAGRAWRYTMTPLIFNETEGFDLENVMITGLLPPHFLSEDPMQDIRSYVSDYLKEEIAAEAVVQNIPAFSDFLRVCAITSSELINYANIGRETGISAKVVKNYFQILEDTLLGFRISPWRRQKNRRLIETEKFYLFDVGICNYLARRTPKLKTSEFGKSFEHYMLMELKAYQAYKNPELDISFWRTASGYEVDFILNDMTTAIEVKGSDRIHHDHTKGLRALAEEHIVKNKIIVCLERQPRKTDNNIEILPWKVFLEKLWSCDYEK